MACGKPTIQPDFGGQTDYMNEGNSWMVPTTKIKANDGHMYEEIMWGMPDIKILREKLRYCFEHRDQVKKKGDQALKDAQEWSWDNSASIALTHLKDLT